MLTRFVLPLFLLCMLMSQTFAQSPNVTVCRFMDDKPAAISLTFDDSLLDHYTVARPLMAEYGIKGTFFVVESYCNQAIANRSDPAKRQYMTWEQVKAMADDGHEIGNHSFNHQGLTRIDASRWDEEINHPIATFQEKLGITPITFCFPGNARNDEILKRVLVHHINARTYQFGIGKQFKIQDAQQWIPKLVNENQWGVVMMHAIVAKYHGYDPLPNEEKDFEDILKLLDSQKDQLWIDTFANVTKYVKLRDAVKIVTDDKQQMVTLKTDLDTAIYDLPLTVKIDVGEHARLIKVMPNTPTSYQ